MGTSHLPLGPPPTYVLAQEALEDTEKSGRDKSSSVVGVADTDGGRYEWEGQILMGGGVPMGGGAGQALVGGAATGEVDWVGGSPPTWTRWTLSCRL